MLAERPNFKLFSNFASKGLDNCGYRIIVKLGKLNERR